MSGMIIQTNIKALDAHRNTKSVASRQFKSAERLSSGLRLNSAADDAAGLAISEKMKAQIRGLNQAQRNSEYGIDLIRTMEGGMDGIQDMMIRQRELIIQALNDTNTDSDKQNIQLEIDQLTAEIASLADRVEYNTLPLLNVPGEGYWIPGSSVGMTLPTGALFPNPTSATPGHASITVSEGTTFTVKVTVEPQYLSGNWPDLIIYAPNGEKFGYNQGGFFNTSSLPSTVNPNAAASVYYTGYNNIATSNPHVEYFTITDVTAAGAGQWMVGMSNQGGNKPITFSLSVEGVDADTLEDLTVIPHGTQDIYVPSELWIQCGANREQGTWVNRYDCRPQSLGISGLVTWPTDAATQSLVNLDNAFGRVNEFRATCGAQQNRLEYTASSLAISALNLEASNSRIADADIAKEMMNLVKANVLQQAGTAMLSQANQAPEAVLQLLR